MKLLLDTHTFIWWDNNPRLLSQHVLELCQNPANTLMLSVVSIWEMQVKSQLGKLKLNMPLSELVANQQRVNSIKIMPVELNHVFALDKLPLHYKDPFDRLLIAQSIVEDATLLSKDSMFSAYPARVVWD